MPYDKDGVKCIKEKGEVNLLVTVRMHNGRFEICLRREDFTYFGHIAWQITSKRGYAVPPRSSFKNMFLDRNPTLQTLQTYNR